MRKGLSCYVLNPFHVLGFKKDTITRWGNLPGTAQLKPVRERRFLLLSPCLDCLHAVLRRIWGILITTRKAIGRMICTGFLHIRWPWTVGRREKRWLVPGLFSPWLFLTYRRWGQKGDGVPGVSVREQIRNLRATIYSVVLETLWIRNLKYLLNSWKDPVFISFPSMLNFLIKWLAFISVCVCVRVCAHVSVCACVWQQCSGSPGLTWGVS